MEALAGEMSDQVRLLYPADAASAVAALQSVYAQRGQLGLLLVPKQEIPQQLTALQVQQLIVDGACRLEDPQGAEWELVAVGAYQLLEMRKVFVRLQERGYRARLIYLQEPMRFRQGRDRWEEQVLCAQPERLFDPAVAVRIFLTHGRPEALLGALRPIDAGPQRCACLGYINQGGTLDVGGLLFANRCTYAHVLYRLAVLSHTPLTRFLSLTEIDAVTGAGDPYAVIPWPHAAVGKTGTSAGTGAVG